MVILSEYEKLLNSADKVSGGFLSLPLDAECIFRLAIDEDQNPSILIDEDKFDNSGWTKTNFSLDKLDIKFNVPCLVQDIGTTAEVTSQFAIIKQIRGNARMHDYFLRVLDGVISELRNDLSAARLNTEIEYLVKLFSSPKKIDERVITGLWGELLYILSTENEEETVTAWHVDRENLFDFSFADYSMEIKTTLKTTRSHEFNNKQVKDYRRLNVKVTSIQTEKAALGKSVLDLWKDLNEKCNRQESRAKVARIISETVTQDLDALSQLKFNMNLGMSTLKSFNSDKIPYIIDNCIQPGISEVRIKINLDMI